MPVKKKAAKRTAKPVTKKPRAIANTDSRGAPPLVKKLSATGDALKSRVMRVDFDFAVWVRNEATKRNKNVTAVTRDIHDMLKAGGGR